jgi:succinate dehydrogenase / fumarate reductase membrane anchor subunit
MVTSVSGFARTGLSDWVIQRISAVILLLYVVLITGFIITTPDISYAVWSGFFAKLWVKIATLFALLSLCAHAWIGLWTVATDYLTSRMLGKFATVLRFLFLLGVQLTLLVYLVWGIDVLWGISQ